MPGPSLTYYLNPMKCYYLCAVLACSVIQLFSTPWTVARQAPLSLEFFRQEYWSGLPFPIPGDLTDPGLKSVFLASPVLASGSFTTEPPGKPIESISHSKFNQVSHFWMIGYVVRYIILWVCAHGYNLLL